MNQEGKIRQFVGVILVKPDGSVLAQHRDNNPEILGPDSWAVIGGKKEEDDESLKIAAVRELYEETGYKSEEDDLKFLTGDTYQTERGVLVQRTIFWAMYDGEQPIQCNEGQSIEFVKPDELSEKKIYTGHEGFFRKAVEKVVSGSPERER